MVDNKPRAAKPNGTFFSNLVITHLTKPATSKIKEAARETFKPDLLPFEAKAPPTKKIIEIEPPDKSDGTDPFLMYAISEPTKVNVPNKYDEIATCIKC